MIKAPHTYAEWVEVLTLLKNKSDDKEVLKAMKSGSLEWQSGVAERFSGKLIQAVNTRMDAAVKQFQTALSRAGGQGGDVERAILALRKEMAFLLQAVDLGVIPEDIRKEYIRMVREQADGMQKSLQESAKADKTGRLASIIRNHKVNSI